MIFPSLKNKVFGYVNLNLEARKYTDEKNLSTETQNLFLNPDSCQEMVDYVHQKYNLDFSFGGWMEDRSFLWKNSYLENHNTFIHLGIDVQVPSGTEVSAGFDGIVSRIECDNPLDGGWGTMIILKHDNEPVFMIHAHLDTEISVKEGDKIKKGTILGKVGKAPENGNWFPHLHLQTVSAELYEKVAKEGSWEAFDGYGLKEEIAYNAKHYPDPMNYISLSDR
jgi:murein DD-endopeptidase MepM/ murein hydrolase activator NlpD